MSDSIPGSDFAYFRERCLVQERCEAAIDEWRESIRKHRVATDSSRDYDWVRWICAALIGIVLGYLFCRLVFSLPLLLGR